MYNALIQITVSSGIVLAVGYMQSEKHRILSQKLQSTEILVTTWRPKIPYFDTTTDAYTTLNPELETSSVKNNETELDVAVATESFDMNNDDDSEEIEIYEIPQTNNTSSKLPVIRLSEQTAYEPMSEQVTEPRKQSELPAHKEDELDQHRSPAEVKVLPPNGFEFNGFSFGIPIYNKASENKQILANDDFSLTYPKPALTTDLNVTPDSIPPTTGLTGFPLQELTPESGSLEIIPASKLHTDLFSSSEDEDEDDFSNGEDSEMSASGRGRIPKIIPSDNMYTPRPGTNPIYPDRPKFSSHYNQKTLLEKFSSNRSEVRVPPPSTTPKPEVAAETRSKTTPADFSYNGNSIETPKFEVTTASPLTDYQIATPSAITVATTAPTLAATTPFHFDFSQLTTPAPATSATSPTLHISPYTPQIQPETLSKRTFNFEFETAATTNPFANILGNQGAITGVIGSASTAGATLGLQNQYNFDNNFDSSFSFQPLPSLNIPSGTVPIDLASSYIQAGPKQTNTRNSADTDYNTAYSNTNPTVALASLIQNGGNNAQARFPSITTSALNPNPPSYNTITQGIHLLSLLSGSIPQHLIDSQASASTINEQAARPELQIAALAGYGGSAGSFLNNGQGSPSQSSGNPAVNFQSYSADLYPSKSLPEASQSSFGQNIVSKLAEYSNFHKQGTPFDSLPSASEFIEVKASTKSSAVRKEPTEKEVSGILRIPQVKEVISVTDSEPSASETRETTAGKDYINLIPDKPVINFAKRLSSSTKLTGTIQQFGAKGLKSGFYT